MCCSSTVANASDSNLQAADEVQCVAGNKERLTLIKKVTSRPAICAGSTGKMKMAAKQSSFHLACQRLVHRCCPGDAALSEEKDRLEIFMWRADGIPWRERWILLYSSTSTEIMILPRTGSVTSPCHLLEEPFAIGKAPQVEILTQTSFSHYHPITFDHQQISRSQENGCFISV